jgi:hypothetical protein
MNLISIVSKNNIFDLIPIIFEFKEKIKNHILIGDSEDTLHLNRLKESIEKLNTLYNLKQDIEIVSVDEDSKKDLSEIQNQLPKDNLYINGIKADNSLLITLSHYVLSVGGEVISYDKFENSYNLISLKDFTNHKINNNLKIRDFLTLCGYKSSYEDIKVQNRSPLKYIFKNSYQLFEVMRYIRDNDIDKIPSRMLQSLQNIGVIKDGKVNNKLSFGYLFEVFIFDRLKEYNFDDIEINVKIEFDDEVINEFDILAMKDNHIFAIECKLGTEIDAENVIYKLDSIIEHFGDDSKGLIVNLQGFRDFKRANPVRKIFSESKIKRASLKNIAIFNEYFFDESRFDNLVSKNFNVISNRVSESKKPIFLLGGQDLEMVEIKKILKERGAFYIDRELGWGAKLSQYRDILNDEQSFYGVELTEDIEPPKHYTLIDHHNENQDRGSSLEQIAKIFGIELNRFQKLVAINDKSYIDGLKRFGATDVEIEYIRKLDREAQGVTEEDEYLATISIESSIKIGDITVVKSLTDKFSPIIDKLYGKKVLIYRDDHLNYYGDGVKKLISNFKSEIKENIAYYGGDYGFFGVDLKNRKQESIKKYKNRVLKVLGVI